MEFGPWLTWDVLSLLFTGLFITALGSWVFILKPGDERHQAFGLYLFLYGLVDVQQAIPFADARDMNAMSMVVAWSLLAAVVALVWFMLVYPRPRFKRDRKRAVLVAVARLAAALAVTALVLHDTGRTSRADGSLAISPIYVPFTFFWTAGLAVAPLVFAVDALRSTEGQERRALRLVTMACLIWPLYDLVYMAFRVADPMPVASGEDWYARGILWRLAANFVAVVAALVLLTATHRHRERFAPIAIAILAGPALALTLEGLGLDQSIGLADLALPILVTIAILRGGLFGLDVKLRFAISKSTVAALFIAVFFVASEVAQQFFSETTSSTYIGIGIAGTLVFAMSPIQRAAEKLAEKAVPVVPLASVASPPAGAAAGDRHAVYRATVRRFLRDGSISRDEERTLAHLAAELGIDARAAFQAREDAEGAAHGRTRRRGRA